MTPAHDPTTPATRVVIAEDEAPIRLDLAEMLAEEGYDVVAQASDGEQAVALVVEHRPDVVLTGSWEIEFVAGLNQADHRVAGIATLDAIRDADNPWVFPELVEEGLAPHRVRWFLVGGHTQPTHGVDVTGDALAKGVASLEAHSQYLGAIEGHPPPSFLIPMIAAQGGRAIGVEHAVLFRAFDFDAPPPIAQGE